MNYANNEAILRALYEVRALRQKASENVEQFHARFLNAHAPAGSSWDVNQCINCNIDGIFPE